MTKQLEAVQFSRNYEVVINPLVFWSIQPGTLFFTVDEYQTNGTNSRLFLKLTNDQCTIADVGTLGTLEPETPVYMVLKNA